MWNYTASDPPQLFVPPLIWLGSAQKHPLPPATHTFVSLLKSAFLVKGFLLWNQVFCQERRPPLSGEMEKMGRGCSKEGCCKNKNMSRLGSQPSSKGTGDMVFPPLRKLMLRSFPKWEFSCTFAKHAHSLHIIHASWHISTQRTNSTCFLGLQTSSGCFASVSLAPNYSSL